MIGLVAGLVLLPVVAASAPTGADCPREDPAARYRVPTGGSPARGGPDALVTVVVFSDFQCPYCGRLAATLDELLEAYGADLRVVFKQMPLAFHQNAQLAAEAALAAHAQGKFWAFHDLLFANQSALAREDLERYAEQAGLNLRKFRRALDDHTYADEVAADSALAERFRITGTPTMVINGRKKTGALPADQIRPVIDEEIVHANELIAAGTSRAGVYDAILAAASERVVCLPADPAAPSPARPGAAPTPAAAPSGAPEVVGTAAWNLTRGSLAAPVTVVVFTEFLCPFCARLEETLARLREAYGSRVRVVYRYYQVHAGADELARAVLAAAYQGRGIEMHDAFFREQSSLRDVGAAERIAETLGLDLTRFRNDRAGDQTEEQVAADNDEARRLGVTGTPTLFVNGRRSVGARPVEQLGELIDRELGITTPTFPAASP